MSKSKYEKALDKFIGETAKVAQSLDYAEGDIRGIPLGEIFPNEFQPRKTFENIDKLAKSIEKDGLIEPVVVRKKDNGYELVVGERRFEAVKRLGWEEIPAVVKDFADIQMVEIALVENLQRDDLNAIEEAEGVLNLLRHRMGLKDSGEVRNLLYQMNNEKYGLGKFRHDAGLKEAVFEVFEVLGQRWDTFLKHKVPLLTMPDDLQLAIIEGNLSPSHTEDLRKIEDKETRTATTEYVIRNRLGVRETKEMVKKIIAEESPEKIVKRDNRRPVTHFEEAPGLKIRMNNTKVHFEIDLKKGDLKKTILYLSKLVRDNKLQEELKIT